ncbi:unnamed protein product [Protopolystoma xenopodis]|uniref:Uncharacterized protein n=1 Tax=Protopolystoma xenopodis TaxID=117903 RepID=A0A3S5BVW6_9PLAT|nr:unnamed protein product [Protopolystoma xenopodis]
MADKQAPSNTELGDSFVVVDTPAEDVAFAPEEFWCTGCSVAGLDGNSLARHLVELCGRETVTRQPDAQLVAARRAADEAEAAALAEAEALAATSIHGLEAVTVDTGHLVLSREEQEAMVLTGQEHHILTHEALMAAVEEQEGQAVHPEHQACFSFIIYHKNYLSFK